MRLRIISGRFGGRLINAPPGHKTHPMSEKIRGAIFNALGDIDGLTLLDAFAGSGAICFEAISRGAKQATAIEIDRAAHRTMQENAQTLGAMEIKMVRANASSWSDNNPDMQFDIVILDPPYDQVKKAQLQKMAAHAKMSGIVVMSLPTLVPALNTNFELLSSKSYGDATLAFYKKTG